MLSILSRRIRVLCLLAAFISLAAPGWATDNTFPILQAASGQATVSADIDSLRKQALEEAEAGKTDAANRDYQRVLEIQPDWKEGRWNLGMLQYSSDRFGEAEQTFQKVVQFAPNLGLAWGLLGLSEYGVKDYDHALEHLERAQALGIAEDEEIARVSTYHLGILRIRAGKFESASDLLLAAFGTGVVSPQAKIALGLAMLRVPLLPEQLDPSREALVLAAGDAAIAGADGAARWATLLQQNPSVPYLHYAYGVSLAMAGKEKEAADAMAAETTLSPDSPLPWIALGRLKLRRGLVNDALKDAHEATRHAPNDKTRTHSWSMRCKLLANQIRPQ